MLDVVVSAQFLRFALTFSLLLTVAAALFVGQGHRLPAFRLPRPLVFALFALGCVLIGLAYGLSTM